MKSKFRLRHLRIPPRRRRSFPMTEGGARRCGAFLCMAALLASMGHVHSAEPLSAPAADAIPAEPEPVALPAEPEGDALPAEPKASEEGSAVAAEPIASGGIEGRVLEKGVRKPLGAAQVFVMEQPDEAYETDEKGHFVIENLPPGTYTLVVTITGYEKGTFAETIRVGERVKVIYYLEPQIYGLDEIVVRGQKNRTEVSRQVVTKAELKAMPGSGGDAVRAIENIPGVGDNASSGGLVLRGSNREDSSVFLDGHFIPLLFHFGGFKSVYNADLLDDIEVLLGGFSAEFGGAIGGIVNLRSKDPRRDRWAGYLDTSLLDVTALAEGPIGDNGAMELTVRYSLIQFVMRAIPTEDIAFTSYPNYYDFVARYDHWLNKAHKLEFSIYGARDGIEIKLQEVSDADPAITGQMGLTTSFYTGVAAWELNSGLLDNRLSLAVGSFALDAFLGQDFYFTIGTISLDIKESASLKLTKRHTLRMGFHYDMGYATVEGDIISPPKEGDAFVSVSNDERFQVDTAEIVHTFALWAEDVMTYGPVSIIPGLRFAKAFNLTDGWYLDPRLTVRWDVHEKVTLKSSVGWYHQFPQPDEVFKPFGVQNLDPEGALQVGLGVEWAITDAIDLNVEGYYKYLHDLVVSDNVKIYDNDGSGRIWGVEVMLRHKFSRDFFGWIGYTYIQSRRKDGPDYEYRPFDEDVPHSFTLVLSYKFLKTWQIGTRLQVTSGQPYTPFKGSLYIADNNSYVPIYDNDNKNSARMPTWYQWDLRLDKRFVFDTWILSVYLDVQNVTTAKRVLGYTYNFDYSRSSEMTFLPILPTFGIRAEF